MSFRWAHKGGALKMGSVSLQEKETTALSLPCGDAREAGPHQHWTAERSVLDFPASRTVRSKCPSLCVCGAWWERPEWTAVSFTKVQTESLGLKPTGVEGAARLISPPGGMHPLLGSHHLCRRWMAHPGWRSHSCRSGWTGGSSLRPPPPPSRCCRPASPPPLWLCRTSPWTRAHIHWRRSPEYGQLLCKKGEEKSCQFCFFVFTPRINLCPMV